MSYVTNTDWTITGEEEATITEGDGGLSTYTPYNILIQSGGKLTVKAGVTLSLGNGSVPVAGKYIKVSGGGRLALEGTNGNVVTIGGSASYKALHGIWLSGSDARVDGGYVTFTNISAQNILSDGLGEWIDLFNVICVAPDSGYVVEIANLPGGKLKDCDFSSGEVRVTGGVIAFETPTFNAVTALSLGKYSTIEIIGTITGAGTIDSGGIGKIVYKKKLTLTVQDVNSVAIQNVLCALVHSTYAQLESNKTDSNGVAALYGIHKIVDKGVTYYYSESGQAGVTNQQVSLSIAVDGYISRADKSYWMSANQTDTLKIERSAGRQATRSVQSGSAVAYVASTWTTIKSVVLTKDSWLRGIVITNSVGTPTSPKYRLTNGATHVYPYDTNGNDVDSGVLKLFDRSIQGKVGDTFYVQVNCTVANSAEATLTELDVVEFGETVNANDVSGKRSAHKSTSGDAVAYVTTTWTTIKTIVASEDTEITGIKITNSGSPVSSTYRITSPIITTKVWPYNSSGVIVSGWLRQLEEGVFVPKGTTFYIQVYCTTADGTATLTELDYIERN